MVLYIITTLPNPTTKKTQERNYEKIPYPTWDIHKPHTLYLLSMLIQELITIIQYGDR